MTRRHRSSSFAKARRTTCVRFRPPRPRSTATVNKRSMTKFCHRRPVQGPLEVGPLSPSHLLARTWRIRGTREGETANRGEWCVCVCVKISLELGCLACTYPPFPAVAGGQQTQTPDGWSDCPAGASQRQQQRQCRRIDAQSPYGQRRPAAPEERTSAPHERRRPFPGRNPGVGGGPQNGKGLRQAPGEGLHR